jgi:5'-3' exonuclease
MHYNYRTAQFLHTSPEEALKFLWLQTLMGDSTDNIAGIPGVGVKTAENWLKDRSKDFEGFALKKYVEKFGMIDGMFKFHQTFRLVYLLKSKEDVLRETNLTLPELTPIKEEYLFIDPDSIPAPMYKYKMDKQGNLVEVDQNPGPYVKEIEL